MEWQVSDKWLMSSSYSYLGGWGGASSGWAVLSCTWFRKRILFCLSQVIHGMNWHNAVPRLQQRNIWHVCQLDICTKTSGAVSIDVMWWALLSASEEGNYEYGASHHFGVTCSVTSDLVEGLFFGKDSVFFKVKLSELFWYWKTESKV